MVMQWIKGFFGSKPPKGAVDIGTHSIKIAIVEQGESQPKLVALLQIPTPVGSVQQGNIIDTHAVGTAISAAIIDSGVSVEELQSVIAGQQVIIRPVPMVQMSKEDLQSAIRYEANQYLPYDASEAEISVTIIDPDIGKKQMEVLLIAVPKDAVQNINGVIQLAGYEPAGVGIESIALYSAAKQNYQGQSWLGQCFGVLDIGASACSCHIFSQSSLKHCRTVSVAGNQLTRDIAEELSLSEEEAEVTKIQSAKVFSDGDEPAAPREQQVVKAIAGTLDRMALELQRSLDFYRSRYKEQVSMLLLTGGTANLPGLADFLSKKTGVQVQLLDPFQGLDTSGALVRGGSSLVDCGASSGIVTGIGLG